MSCHCVLKDFSINLGLLQRQELWKIKGYKLHLSESLNIFIALGKRFFFQMLCWIKFWITAKKDKGWTLTKIESAASNILWHLHFKETNIFDSTWHRNGFIFDYFLTLALSLLQSSHIKRKFRKRSSENSRPA